MKKKVQGLIAGILVGAIFASMPVLAKSMQQTINAVYNNIRIVIDGIEVTPKDVDGNVVEPFIYNGTTYLPVRAVGEAFGKDVSWDGANATVYIGEVEKPAKEVFLYDKPYLECGKASTRSAGENNNSHVNYIGFVINYNKWKKISSGNYEHSNSVTYALNGLAKKVTGTFTTVDKGENGSAEYTVSFYDENDILLYQSPIMAPSVSAVDFEFETGNALKLKIVFNAYSSHGSSIGAWIDNLAIYTTDY